MASRKATEKSFTTSKLTQICVANVLQEYKNLKKILPFVPTTALTRLIVDDER